MAASIGSRYPVFTAFMLCLALLVSGCVSAVRTAPESKTDHQVEAFPGNDDLVEVFFSAVAAQPSQENANAQKNIDVPVVPVIRSGRYRLIEITPQAAQSDLMAQVVDVAIPATFNKKDTTVADGLRYVLMHSGYRLCSTGDAVNVLDSLPLPAAHTHIGPMMLKDALQTLVGSAWMMVLDEAVREVCFQRSDDSRFSPNNKNNQNILPDNGELPTEGEAS